MNTSHSPDPVQAHAKLRIELKCRLYGLSEHPALLFGRPRSEPGFSTQKDAEDNARAVYSLAERFWKAKDMSRMAPAGFHSLSHRSHEGRAEVYDGHTCLPSEEQGQALALDWWVRHSAQYLCLSYARGPETGPTSRDYCGNNQRGAWSLAKIVSAHCSRDSDTRAEMALQPQCCITCPPQQLKTRRGTL